MNSPTEPLIINIGKNAAMMVAVAVSTGTTSSVAERQAASARGTPRSSNST